MFCVATDRFTRHNGKRRCPSIKAITMDTLALMSKGDELRLFKETTKNVLFSFGAIMFFQNKISSRGKSSKFTLLFLMGTEELQKSRYKWRKLIYLKNA